MKFTIDDISEFKQALAFASKVIAARPSHPVLAMLKLKAEGDRVTISAFDLKLSIQVSTPATVAESGEVCVDKLFADQIGRQSGKMTFTQKSETEAQLRFAGSKYTTRLGEVAAFPELTAVTTQPVPIGDLALNVAKVLYAVSTEDSKGVLQGLHLKDGQVAATDGHRLATVASAELPSCTILGEHLKKFAAILTPETLLAVSPQVAQFTDANNNWMITTRLLEGQYPNFNQLIPKQFALTAECDRALLLGAISRLSLLADNAGNIMQLRFLKADGKLSVYVKTQEHGDGEERIPFDVAEGQWGGDDFAIACNYKYLNAAVKAITSDLVRFQMNSAISPLVITGDDSTHLIMPVQIREKV